jgi:hypothetical protein
MNETLNEWFKAYDPGANVDLTAGGRVHNWRNYLPTILCERWLFLSPGERAIAFVMAEAQSDRENWE